MPVPITPISGTMTLSSVIAAAREVVGAYVDNNSAERYVPDEAIQTIMAGHIRRLNRIMRVSTSAKVVTFTSDGTQSVPMADIAEDIGQVNQVLRSSMYQTGVNGGSAGHTGACEHGNHGMSWIDPFLQGRVFSSIESGNRHEAMQDFDWQVESSESDGPVLTLFPIPLSGELIRVEYTTSSSSVANLPAEAEQAAVYAACVALLDSQINRINSQGVDHITTLNGTGGFSATSLERVQILQAQRDRYEALFERELTDLG